MEFFYVAILTVAVLLGHSHCEERGVNKRESEVRPLKLSWVPLIEPTDLADAQSLMIGIQPLGSSNSYKTSGAPYSSYGRESSYKDDLGKPYSAKEHYDDYEEKPNVYVLHETPRDSDASDETYSTPHSDGSEYYDSKQGERESSRDGGYEPSNYKTTYPKKYDDTTTYKTPFREDTDGYYEDDHPQDSSSKYIPTSESSRYQEQDLPEVLVTEGESYDEPRKHYDDDEDDGYHGYRGPPSQESKHVTSGDSTAHNYDEPLEEFVGPYNTEDTGVYRGDEYSENKPRDDTSASGQFYEEHTPTYADDQSHVPPPQYLNDEVGSNDKRRHYQQPSSSSPSNLYPESNKYDSGSQSPSAPLVYKPESAHLNQGPSNVNYQDTSYPARTTYNPTSYTNPADHRQSSDQEYNPSTRPNDRRLGLPMFSDTTFQPVKATSSFQQQPNANNRQFVAPAPAAHLVDSLPKRHREANLPIQSRQQSPQQGSIAAPVQFDQSMRSQPMFQTNGHPFQGSEGSHHVDESNNRHHGLGVGIGFLSELEDSMRKLLAVKNAAK